MSEQKKPYRYVAVRWRKMSTGKKHESVVRMGTTVGHLMFDGDDLIVICRDVLIVPGLCDAQITIMREEIEHMAELVPAVVVTGQIPEVAPEVTAAAPFIQPGTGGSIPDSSARVFGEQAGNDELAGPAQESV